VLNPTGVLEKVTPTKPYFNEKVSRYTRLIFQAKELTDEVIISLGFHASKTLRRLFSRIFSLNKLRCERSILSGYDD
jgi:transcriptional regulator GlxA family with amidase domain